MRLESKQRLGGDTYASLSNFIRITAETIEDTWLLDDLFKKSDGKLFRITKSVEKNQAHEIILEEVR